MWKNSNMCSVSFGTDLKRQPAEGEGQHWGHKQWESPLPLLVPALVDVRWLPGYWIAFQADSNGAVRYADWQQRHHVRSYEDEAGIEQPQVATIQPKLLAHDEVDAGGSQVHVARVERRRRSQG